jgi:hypothetical protein
MEFTLFSPPMHTATGEDLTICSIGLENVQQEGCMPTHKVVSSTLFVDEGTMAPTPYAKQNP